MKRTATLTDILEQACGAGLQLPRPDLPAGRQPAAKAAPAHDACLACQPLRLADEAFAPSVRAHLDGAAFFLPLHRTQAPDRSSSCSRCTGPGAPGERKRTTIRWSHTVTSQRALSTASA